MTLLACRGLTRRPWFSGRALDLDEGEIVVVSGPTGSGKTLFLRALADLDPSDEGEAFLHAEERATMPASRWRSRVMYVHQGGVVLPGTVRENVERLTRLGAMETQARTQPMPPGLPGDADAHRLSGGERQILALHCALLCQPDVLLLDECTSALDPQAAATWERRLREWVDQGHAVLWVAHDRALAARIVMLTERFA